MIQRVYNILKTLNLPVQYIIRPDLTSTGIAISYHFYNESFELYADGQGVQSGGVLQVDVFSTTDYSNVVDQIKELLISHKFRFADSRDGDDSLDNIKYYHKILTFNYNEEELI